MSLKDSVEYLDLSTMKPSSYKVTVLYGKTGKRKTTTSLSLVKESGLLVSADNSWDVLEKSIHEDLRKKTTLVIYEGLSQLRSLRFEDYDTVVLDTFDAMVDMYLDMLLQHAKWPSGYREKLTSAHPELQNVTNRGQPDYAVVRDKFRPVVEQLVAAPVHVVFNCHQNEPTKGLNTDLTIRPRLPQATWLLISRPASIVGYLTTRNREFVINVDEASSAYAAKSRVDGISGVMPLDTFVKRYHERVR